jgi:hypothetical protein
MMVSTNRPTITLLEQVGGGLEKPFFGVDAVASNFILD